MEPDTELDTWRRQWQAQDVVPEDLRRRVERELRWKRVEGLMSILVTLVFGLGVPAWAIVSRRVDVAVLAVAVWIFIGINWMVSWSLGRGISKPDASTTRSFLDFSILSCQRRRRAIAAASVLYAGMLIFNLLWVYQARAAPPGVLAFLISGPVAIVAAVTVVLASMAVRRRRQLERELDNLRQWQRDLGRSSASRE
jgi:hypothetical protein